MSSLLATLVFTSCCLPDIAAVLLTNGLSQPHCEKKWNHVSIANQSELDQFVKTASDIWNYNIGRCIHLSLAGDNNYTLDIVDFMNVTSSSLADNGSLVIQAVGSKVEINCMSDQTDLDKLRQILQPISNALLVLLDGLVFINCPVPVLIEEVSVVIIQNCVFL